MDSISRELSADLFMTVSDSSVGLSVIQYGIKTANIAAFFSIDRTGLANKQKEHMLLMYRSLAGETIYIEYPGKESTPEFASSGPDKLLNSYDFRPELYLADGTLIARLSFSDIAKAIQDYHYRISERQMQLFASMLIKMAIMDGYSYYKDEHPRYQVTFDNGIREVSPVPSLSLGRYYLSLSSGLKKTLAQWPQLSVPNRSYNCQVPISIEGLLYYIDSLAQQEDCKYYYLSQKRGRMQMPVGIGRVNSILTIVNVIYHLLQMKPCDEIIGSLKIGVYPLMPQLFEKATGGIITAHEDIRAISKLNVSMD